jgi:hypothetical protein
MIPAAIRFPKRPRPAPLDAEFIVGLSGLKLAARF